MALIASIQSMRQILGLSREPDHCASSSSKIRADLLQPTFTLKDVRTLGSGGECIWHCRHESGVYVWWLGSPWHDDWSLLKPLRLEPWHQNLETTICRYIWSLKLLYPPEKCGQKKLGLFPKSPSTFHPCLWFQLTLHVQSLIQTVSVPDQQTFKHSEMYKKFNVENNANNSNSRTNTIYLQINPQKKNEIKYKKIASKWKNT